MGPNLKYSLENRPVKQQYQKLLLFSLLHVCFVSADIFRQLTFLWFYYNYSV